MTKVQPLQRSTDSEQGSTLQGPGRASRTATRCVSAHLPEDMYWQLKELAALQRVEMQMIIAHAANALFKENNRPIIPITPRSFKGKTAAPGRG